MESNKYILFLPSYYPNLEANFDGNFIQNHARTIALKFKVLVLYVKSTKENKYVIEITQSKNKKLKEVLYYFPYHRSKLIRAYRKLKCYYKLYKLYKNQFSIVHIHVFGYSTLLGIILGLISKNKIFLTEHNSFFHQMTFLKKMFFKCCYRFISGFSAVSNHMKNTMIGLGINKSKIKVIPNVVDVNHFNILKNDKGNKIHFLHISAFHNPRKNIPLILQVVKQLSDKYDNFFLEIGGDGNLDYLNKMITKLKINDKYLRISGEYQYSILPNIYSQADAFVLFSDFENYGVVLAESISCGTPVISTKVGGVVDFVNSKNGKLIAKNDILSLYKEMENFITNTPYYNPKKVRESIINSVSEESILESFTDFYTTYSQ